MDGDDDSITLRCPGGRDGPARMSKHKMNSFGEGDSDVETLANRIEKLRGERLPITYGARVGFWRNCHAICNEKGFQPGRVRLKDLIKLQEEAQAKVDKAGTSIFHRALGRAYNFLAIRDNNKVMLQCLDRAIDITTTDSLDETDCFRFPEFLFYHCRVESMWPFFRTGKSIALFAIFVFYLGTPILFCTILGDKAICPKDPTDMDRSYYGVLTSLYFASTTASTVGYGDLFIKPTLENGIFMDSYGDISDDSVTIVVRTIYMFAGTLVALLAVSTAAQRVMLPFNKHYMALLNYVIGEYTRGDCLHQKIRWFKIVKLFEITFQFFLLNLVGVVAARIVVRYTNEEAEQWSWVKTWYWAVQTTTTIGYGDVIMNLHFRWFQIFYLIISTYFTGRALGKLARLKGDVKERWRFHAWNTQEVSKSMVEQMQPYENDDKIDQFEFVVASMLTLGKIDTDDLKPIMNKYRELACDKGFIEVQNSGL